MGLVLKRFIDILLALLGLLVCWPGLLFSAIGIWVSSYGPILYVSERVGYRGRRFLMYKLRTMHASNEKFETIPITAAQDARIFWFGSVLRLMKIDELPQLINVLKGDMSIVGPRPLSPKIVDSLYTTGELTTLDVRPGLSSPGSIYNYTHCEELVASDDRERCFRERVLPLRLALEHVYLIRSSTVYDFQIIVRTLSVICLKALGRRTFSEPREMQAVRRMMRAFEMETPEGLNNTPDDAWCDVVEAERSAKRALLVGIEEVAKWIPMSVTFRDGSEVKIVSRIEPQRFEPSQRGTNGESRSLSEGTALAAHIQLLDESFDFSSLFLIDGSLPGSEIQWVWRYARDRDRSVRIIPGLVADRRSNSSERIETREVKVTDLFGVEAPGCGWAYWSKLLRNEVVAVTGAASTVGTELARLLVHLRPRRLHLLDGSEEGLAKLQHKVRRWKRKTDVSLRLMDERNDSAVERTLTQIKPTLIIHAGCNLDDGLASSNVGETVYRNLFGVNWLVEHAESVGCRKVVILVGPRIPSAACPLGAITRIAEQHILALPKTKTKKIILRVGHLLDSETGIVRLTEEALKRGEGIRIPRGMLKDKSCTSAAAAARAAVATAIFGERSGVISLNEAAAWDRMEVINTVLEFHAASVDDIPVIVGEPIVDAKRLNDEYEWSASTCEFDEHLEWISLPKIERENLDEVIARLADTLDATDQDIAAVLERSALEFGLPEVDAATDTLPFESGRRRMERNDLGEESSHDSESHHEKDSVKRNLGESTA
ncbi:MAG: sugar transferase [Planctomycetota bacterium]|nr:sugar transferase [Planctomycetota bacterium]